MIYDLLTAVNLVKITIGISENENYKDEIIINLLEDSKAIESYRPFIVASKMIAFFPPREGVIKASGSDGVEWVDNNYLIEGLLDMQTTLDRTLTGVKPGWSVMDSKDEKFNIYPVFSAFNA